MSDRSTLQRNKAVLWARDVISRENECVIAAGHADSGTLSVHSLSGAEITSCSTNHAQSVELLAAKLSGKEVVLAGVPSEAVQSLRAQKITVHDLLEYYKLFVNHPEAELAKDVPQHELANWVKDVLRKMAGSSLVLDQADTGAGKWTSAHFKPNPSMLEKLKTFINSGPEI